MARCPTCGGALQRLPDARDANDVDNVVDVDDWGSGWHGLVAWLGVLLVGLIPWGRRRYRCPRCKKTIER